MSRSAHIVMVGSGDGRGGIRAVVDVYREAGLFERWPILYLATHSTGGMATKLATAGTALVRFLGLTLRGRVRLLHAHSASALSFWRKSAFVAIALAARRPVILHLHGGRFDNFYRQGNVLQRFLIRAILARVARVVVLSDVWVGTVKRICPAARVARLYNPVRGGGAAAVGPDDKEDWALFLGRLEARKGVFDLLAAFAQARARVPAARLLLGGDGDRRSVEQRMRELGLEGAVDLLGWVDGERKAGLLNRAGVFVLPSYIEGLPMSMLEAMQAGATVVATRVGGVPDVITDGVDGFLVPAGDVPALAHALAQALQDRKRRARIGSAAMARVSAEFDVNRILPQLERLYRELGCEPRDRGFAGEGGSKTAAAGGDEQGKCRDQARVRPAE